VFQKNNTMHYTKRKKDATLSYSSPKSSARGCLCPDGRTYSTKCCDGTLEAQGIGKV
tara:strand:+ start:1410 stop:1580 length:171 start_codon:yes stop_codon:yes gene_type:complete